MKLIAIVLVAGCSITTAPQPESQPNAHAPFDAAHVPFDAANPRVTGTCGDPEGPLHAYTTAGELQNLLVGRWQHCSGPTLFGKGEAGIEFTDDGSYYLLDSHLARESGFQGQGTWDLPYHVQVDLELATGGTVPTWLAFEDNPGRFAAELESTSETPIYVAIP